MIPRQWRILMIEDSVADAVLFRRLLEKVPDLTVECVHHTNPEAGLEALRQGGFHCLLLDYMLGEHSGLDVLASLRASGNDVPVVFLTGIGSEAVAVESWRRQAQEYLNKNAVSPAALFQAISSAIEKVAAVRAVAGRQRELEEFAAVAARGLQEPLAGILALAAAIRERPQSRQDPEIAQDLDRITEAAARMSRVVRAMHSYTRAGAAAAPVATVALNEAVDAAMVTLRDDIVAIAARIDVSDLPEVTGEEAALVEVFQHLIANAIRFRSGVPLVVRISATSDADTCRVSVSDNGTGLTAERQREIFRPFCPPVEGEGAGVGLAVSKRIVERHGGEIWVESEPESGSTFHFTLPLAGAVVPVASGRR